MAINQKPRHFFAEASTGLGSNKHLQHPMRRPTCGSSDVDHWPFRTNSQRRATGANDTQDLGHLRGSAQRHLLAPFWALFLAPFFGHLFSAPFLGTLHLFLAPFFGTFFWHLLALPISHQPRGQNLLREQVLEVHAVQEGNDTSGKGTCPGALKASSSLNSRSGAQHCPGLNPCSWVLWTVLGCSKFDVVILT